MVISKRLEKDFLRFRNHLPDDIYKYILENYKIDISGSYAGIPVFSLFGKGSGELSRKKEQIKRDSGSGLGFVVLKSFSYPPSKKHGRPMKVERIKSEDGIEGWTVTWEGGGYPGSIDEYTKFVEDSLNFGKDLVISFSIALPLPLKGDDWDQELYYKIISDILRAWKKGNTRYPFILEIDISPTFIGKNINITKGDILRWTEELPEVIKNKFKRIKLGLKTPNTLFEIDFQIEILEHASKANPKWDFIVYANRLFDKKKGVAYGGPDLSKRNLYVLNKAKSIEGLPEIIGTGNIISGRIAFEYLKANAKALEMHTIFQLPLRVYPGSHKTRTSRSLHMLLFHPTEGLISCLLEVREMLKLGEDKVLKACRLDEYE